MDLKAQSLRRNELSCDGKWTPFSLILYWAAPVGGLGRDPLACPYLTNADNFKRCFQLAGMRGKVKGTFLHGPLLGVVPSARSISGAIVGPRLHMTQRARRFGEHAGLLLCSVGCL